MKPVVRPAPIWNSAQRDGESAGRQFGTFGLLQTDPLRSETETVKSAYELANEIIRQAGKDPDKLSDWERFNTVMERIIMKRRPTESNAKPEPRQAEKQGD